MRFKSKKVKHDGMQFDSKAEYSCYLKLVDAFGKKNVHREFKEFTISKAGRYNCKVYRSWGKTLSDRKFPHDDSERIFTPDFIVSHNKKLFIVEFKNPYMQSADYPLRRTLFLRSWNAKNYEAFFECKRQSEVEEAIYIIQKWQ